MSENKGSHGKLLDFLDFVSDPKDGGKNIKLIFDHIRNYLIAASVMAAGLYILKYGSKFIILPYVGMVTGILLSISGFTLYVMNLVVALKILSKTNFSKNRYLSYTISIFMSMSLLISVGDLIFSFVDKYMSSLN
ncbi:hypothetical protein [Thalassospira sp.]|uniref:hypothetical protein n=1 Tax=Thalassospira sp. TaxID=1912094 RepID=UPI0027376319|nr:hypothetical protein [Thalassospira sp.]MDP2698696.1 hypothetical protein [Thalassospira sp.]